MRHRRNSECCHDHLGGGRTPVANSGRRPSDGLSPTTPRRSRVLRNKPAPARLVDETLAGYDRIIGLDLSEVADGAQHTASFGGGGTGPDPATEANVDGSGQTRPNATGSSTGRRHGDRLQLIGDYAVARRADEATDFAGCGVFRPGGVQRAQPAPPRMARASCQLKRSP